MQTKATIEQPGSPVPGVIPDPVRVEYESTASGPRPRSGAWARFLSVLHGDKYLVPADPPTWEPRPTATGRSPTKARSDESAAAAAGTRDAS